MSEYGPQHVFSYRQEILLPLFTRIDIAESCAVVGSASMGKTRLLDFIFQEEVQKYYLKEKASQTLLLRADCNRIAKHTEWGLHELLLTSMVEGCGQNALSRPRRQQLNEWREPVVREENSLLAKRQLELAAHVLIREVGLQLCIIIDEFDALYKQLDPLALASLRGLRDMNKTQLSYVLILRNTPEALRDPSDCESFYELFSRFIYGLKPYSSADSERVLAQLEERRKNTLALDVKAEVIRLSGGHPGLILALFDLLSAHPEWIKSQPGEELFAEATIFEECRKLWFSLSEEEQQELIKISQGSYDQSIFSKRLESKGLLKTGAGVVSFFSPLFCRYVQKVNGAK